MTVFTKFLQPPFPTVLIFSLFVDFFALFSPFSRYHRKIRITIPLIISIDKMMTTLVPFLPELDFKQTSVMKETIANTNNITLKGLINARFIR